MVAEETKYDPMTGTRCVRDFNRLISEDEQLALPNIRKYVPRKMDVYQPWGSPEICKFVARLNIVVDVFHINSDAEIVGVRDS